ncbi:MULTISPECIES: glycosyltransferase family 2 protein [Halococcus]|uniref:Glycosyl transferase n=1 Tax=Halococcus salifodinae DSM 8989 TaxID=1227456 RepID=M0NA68_9EURY|nr:MULTISPECIES: glycosyltransferase family 2 protein [Halococcus]EMA53520.1 glycosyl transferase [Halococcus salifodinae DSM 8989]
MNDEIISIIIPTYFRNEQLAETIRSVHEQRYDPVEIIVVDDSGEGHAADDVDEFEDVVYIQLAENRGAQAARNVGLDVATGEYVQFLDDDDRIDPEKLPKQVAALRERPNASVAFCGIQYDSGEVHLPPPEVSGTVLEQALGFWNDIWRYSTLLVERSALDVVGPLQDTFEGSGDIWLRVELARITEFVAIREPLVFVGEGGEHLGLSWTALESRWKLLDRYEPLYDEADRDVRRHALAEANRLKALLYLRERRWSPRAILAFARVAYYAPTDRAQHIAELAASLFGRSGHELGRRFQHAVLDQLR